jgi:hypothetical protein
MRIVPAISLMLLCATPLVAQDAAAATGDSAQRRSLAGVAQGERVMLIEGRGFRQSALVGRVLAADSASVTLVDGRGDTTRVAAGRVTQAFRSEGSRPRRRSAATGALAGLVIGGMAGYAAGTDCAPNAFLCFDRGETTPMGAMAGMALGALIGLAVGGGERWQPLTVPGGVSLELRPIEGRLALRF